MTSASAGSSCITPPIQPRLPMTRLVELDMGEGSPANVSRRFEWRIATPLVPRPPVGSSLIIGSKSSIRMI